MRNLMQIAGLATVIFVATTSLSQEGETSVWGHMPDGKAVQIFTLSNKQGTRVKVAEYGALLVSIETADQQGQLDDITLSYGSLEEALSGGVFGSVIGRFANRIDQGGFSIDGERFDLESINPKTQVHIHGGKTGFHRQLWSAKSQQDQDSASVVLSLVSDDGHEGYPGRVEVTTTYTLTNDNLLTVHYEGTTDRPTHLNLTNHAYFNLAGSGTVLDQSLRMNCRQLLEFDDRNIPTGILLDIKGTPFDFLSAKPVGRDIANLPGGGYDHCFVVPDYRSPSPIWFARLEDPGSGRFMEISTTCPGVQIYTANHFKGAPYQKWGGICFETQYFPDTPNQPGFPSSLLRPGETYSETTEFRFGLCE